MKLIPILNLLILNVVLVIGVSYFWSFYTFKLFKPWFWLEARKTKKLPKVLQKIERTFKDKNLFYSIWFTINGLENKSIQGSMAEVGVDSGSTARLIHHLSPQRTFYLFDTFSGRPQLVEREDCDGNMISDTINTKGLTAEAAIKVIGGNTNVVVCEGDLAQTIQRVNDESFAFVHIDGNTFDTTSAALAFFYPRLVSGGALLIRDYNHKWEGVKRAVDEFILTIPENYVSVPDMYGSVILVKNK